MSAKLTRSKTTGNDKDVAFRMVHISSCCYLVSPSWLSTGWTLLKSLADFPRDFLFPAPASNCKLRDAEQSFVTTSVQRAILSDHVRSIILDPAFRQIFSTQRHCSIWEFQRTRETTSECGALKEATATPELQHG